MATRPKFFDFLKGAASAQVALVCVLLGVGISCLIVTGQQNRLIKDRDFPRLRFAMDLNGAVSEVQASLLKASQKPLEFAVNEPLVGEHSRKVEEILSRWSPDDRLTEQWGTTKISIKAVLAPLRQRSNLRILVDGRSMAISDFMARLALGNAQSMDALNAALQTGKFDDLNSDPDGTPFSRFKSQFRTNDALLTDLINQYSAAENRVLMHLEEYVLANPPSAEIGLLQLDQDIIPILNDASNALVRYVDQALVQFELEFEKASIEAQQDLELFSELAAAYHVSADLAVKNALAYARLASRVGFFSLLILSILCAHTIWRKRTAISVQGHTPPMDANEHGSRERDQFTPSNTLIQLSDIHDRFQTVSDVMGALSRRIDQHASTGPHSGAFGADIQDISRQVEQTKAVFDALLRKNESELALGLGPPDSDTKANGKEAMIA